jgi:hypothetical protein
VAILKKDNVKLDNMKDIEKIKFIYGLTLVTFAIIGGVIFFLESFKILDEVLSTSKTSRIWEEDSTPIFLGLCGLAGAYLLASVKQKNTETKMEDSSEQKNN